jgi:5'-phosphate synthase pdxT subunit
VEVRLLEVYGDASRGGEWAAVRLRVEGERILDADADGLAEPLRGLIRAGTPTLGTCAGLIMLDRDHLSLLDVSSRRNAFGRQVQSFESDIELDGFGPLRAVFIRAPWVEEHGPEVEVLAEVDGHPVAVRQGDILAVAFHPELTDDDRLHRWLVERSNGAPAR